MPYPKTLLDYGTLEGGLVRMIERFKKEGTLIGNAEADHYIMSDPNAALLGMLYDQRILAEVAFTGPLKLYERLGHLDMRKIAAMDEEKFKEVFGRKPAVHRFTNVMADRTQAVARVLADEYDGDASRIWNDGSDFSLVQKRLMELPGFGKQKAQKMKFVLHYFGHRAFSE